MTVRWNSRRAIAAAVIGIIFVFDASPTIGVPTKSLQPKSRRIKTTPARQPLVTPAPLPPALFNSTYLGGPGFEITWQCAVDKNGNVYIAGDAQEANFPVTSKAAQKTYGDGGQDGFVAKYDKNGNLLWST